MARLDETFDPSTVPAAQPIEAGWYRATITESELKQTQSGGGQYIKAKFVITGPTHEGRVVFNNFNVRNQSTEAESMGRRQLASLMTAAGLRPIKDSDELLNASCLINVIVKPGATGKDGKWYDEKNEIKGYKAIEGIASAMAQASAPATEKPITNAPFWNQGKK